MAGAFLSGWCVQEARAQIARSQPATLPYLFRYFFRYQSFFPPPVAMEMPDLMYASALSEYLLRWWMADQEWVQTD